jgi:hypothetical protein
VRQCAKGLGNIINKGKFALFHRAKVHKSADKNKSEYREVLRSGNIVILYELELDAINRTHCVSV